MSLERRTIKGTISVQKKNQFVSNLYKGSKKDAELENCKQVIFGWYKSFDEKSKG